MILIIRSSALTGAIIEGGHGLCFLIQFALFGGGELLLLELRAFFICLLFSSCPTSANIWLSQAGGRMEILLGT